MIQRRFIHTIGCDFNPFPIKLHTNRPMALTNVGLFIFHEHLLNFMGLRIGRDITIMRLSSKQ